MLYHVRMAEIGSDLDLNAHYRLFPENIGYSVSYITEIWREPLSDNNVLLC